jgi:hypothetical protein
LRGGHGGHGEHAAAEGGGGDEVLEDH